MHIARVLAPLAAFAVAALSFTTAATAESAAPGEETKSLDQLYQDAINEGGNLVVYHGGDTPTQMDFLGDAFRAAYPKINFTLVVDYSKYHNVRIDNQLATNSLVADVVALQTLNDYPRWKSQGQLLCYKPAGFSKIYPGFVDPDGTWSSHLAVQFSYFYDVAQLNASGLPEPKSAKDLANPIYKNHIASSYPHDDDAALFVYSQYVEKYGWDWVKALAEQNVSFNRGANTASDKVAAKKYAIGVASVAPFGATTVVTVSGAQSTTPYLAWGQRIAILKKARHPAAAKLFVNWAVSKQTQSTVLAGFSTRTDLPAIPGPDYPWNIKQANSLKFPTFMEDRANVERLKATFALYFKEVVGEPSPGQLGLHPGL